VFVVAACRLVSGEGSMDIEIDFQRSALIKQRIAIPRVASL
jgi:hypothetical protein